MQPSWLLHTGQEISHSDFTSQRYFGVSWCLFITSLHVVEVHQCLFFLNQCVVSVSVSISGNPHCYDALYWHITIVSIHSLPHKLIQSRITITTWSNNGTHWCCHQLCQCFHSFIEVQWAFWVRGNILFRVFLKDHPSYCLGVKAKLLLLRSTETCFLVWSESIPSLRLIVVYTDYRSLLVSFWTSLPLTIYISFP